MPHLISVQRSYLQTPRRSGDLSMTPDSDSRQAENANGRFDDDFDPDLETNDPDPHVIRETDFEARFREARREIKLKERFRSEAEVDEFFNALVDVVKHNDIKSEDVELLVRRLVQVYPDLLRYSNKDRYNPVYLAIRSSNHQIVDYMISTCVKNKEHSLNGGKYLQCLDDALQMSAQEGKTCLHIAFKEALSHETLQKLIENASDKTLEVQDVLGKTPMHYAVSFSKCTDMRTQIISQFIERDLKALESEQGASVTFLDLHDKNGLSVYREHQITREEVTKKYEEHKKKKQGASSSLATTNVSGATDKATLRDPKDAAGPQASNDDALQAASARLPGNQNAHHTPDKKDDSKDKTDDRERLRRQKKVEEAASGQSKREGRGGRTKDHGFSGRDTDRNAETKSRDVAGKSASTAIRTSGNVRQPDPSPNISVRRSDTARFDDSPVENKSTTRQNPKKMEVLYSNSDLLSIRLKLHYMRTRSAERAITFIHGTNMDGKLYQQGVIAPKYLPFARRPNQL